MISFKCRQFQKEIVLLVVRWYVSYSLSYRDIEEMVLERGIHVDHSTINRWVIHYSPFKAFFAKAIDASGLPEKVTIDKSGSNHAGLNAINLQFILFYLLGCVLTQINIRQIKYLNNIVEQDHRGIKRIINPMMGFKVFRSAEATLSGIELYRMLKKGQHVDVKNSITF